MHDNQSEWDKNHRSKRMQQGLRVVRVWVPEEYRDAIIELATELREAHLRETEASESLAQELREKRPDASKAALKRRLGTKMRKQKKD